LTVEEEIARAEYVGLRCGVSVEVHDLPAAGGIVGKPMGQSGTVRIAGLGEVDPVLPHLLGEGAILRAYVELGA
jgi:hypothetical protein